MHNKNLRVNQMTQGALFAALCYIGFQFLRIDIALPGGGKTAIHFGNAFCVLAALLLNNPYGYLAGAVGMTIADLTSADYAIYAPKTFVLKLCIALIVGLVAHKIAHIEDKTDKKDMFKWSLIASIAGMSFNVVADPLLGYVYKLMLGVEANLAATLAKITAASTFVNAVTAVAIATMLYCVLRPILLKAGFVKS
jgi:uncharacterized membrane protein